MKTFCFEVAADDQNADRTRTIEIVVRSYGLRDALRMLAFEFAAEHPRLDLVHTERVRERGGKWHSVKIPAEKLNRYVR